MSASVPFARSYWVEPGRLLAGSYPGDLHPAHAEAKLAGLVEAGITQVVSLMEAEETDHSGNPFQPYAERFRELSDAAGRPGAAARHPIVDGSIPTVDEMRATLDTIDRALATDPPGRVYVHCWGGRGRTGTAVGCWLIRHGKATPEQALGRIQELVAHNAKAFHPTPEHEPQRAFVRAWKEGQ